MKTQVEKFQFSHPEGKKVKDIYDFKLKGHDVLRGRSLLWVHFEMVKLFANWSDIGIRKIYYVSTSSLSICQKNFWLCLFLTILDKKHEFLTIFNLNDLYWWDRQSQKILIKMKSLGPKNIFLFPKCYKSSNIDSSGLVQSWVSV